MVPDLSCRELVELATDYLEGVLPAVDRERFEAHMAACEGCGAYVEQIRATIDLVGRTRLLAERPDIAGLLAAFRARGRSA